MCHLKEKKLNRSIVARYCMLCVTFLARCVVKVMLSGLACWFCFCSFLFLFKDNRSLQLQKWCALWAGSIAWYIEKKVVILLAGCKHLCDRLCAQNFWADTGKKNNTHVSTLEVHLFALNFYDTWLWHIFMDKWNDGCPLKWKENIWWVRKLSVKWLIVL